MWSPLVCPGVFRQGLNCGVFLGSAAGLRAKGGRSLKGACETPAQAEPREGSGDSLEHGGACPVLRELRCPRCVRLNGAKRHRERTLPSGRVGPGPMLRKADGAQVGGTAVREVLGGEDVCRVPGAGEERGGWREGKKVAMWGGAWEDLGVYLRMMGNHGGLLRGQRPSKCQVGAEVRNQGSQAVARATRGVLGHVAGGNRVATGFSPLPPASLPFAILTLVSTPYKRGFYCGDDSIRYPYRPDTVTHGLMAGVTITATVILVRPERLGGWGGGLVFGEENPLGRSQNLSRLRGAGKPDPLSVGRAEAQGARAGGGARSWRPSRAARPLSRSLCRCQPGRPTWCTRTACIPTPTSTPTWRPSTRCWAPSCSGPP